MSQNKLYVGNLSFDTTQSELEAAFSEFGTVESVTIVTDRDTGRPRGFGFVEMSSSAEAQAAIEGLDNRDLGGRTLKINVAKPREDRGGGGRGGFGGGGWFDWYQGSIFTTNPDQATVSKLLEFASHFGARVQGDGGELYQNAAEWTPR